MRAHFQHLSRRCGRCIATQSPNNQPTTPRIQKALHEISTLPEVSQAFQTPDAQLATTLLNRVLQLVSGAPQNATATPRPSMGKNYEAVVHGLLARHYHRVGDITSERSHRLQSISALWLDASGLGISNNTVGDEHAVSDENRALLSASHIALALSCLRAPGSEAQLAASAAAATAERFAFTEHHRLAASLLTAVSTEKGSPRQTMMLSALTAMDSDSESAAVDVPGVARYFLATLAGVGGQADIGAVDQARALVVRWDGRGGFDYVEALCAAAMVLMKREGKRGWDQAEDFLTRALKEVDSIGNKLDKGEPLLGLARLYSAKGQAVEAEGLYRGVEEGFEPVLKRMAFTVSSADLYSRAMGSFASFLARVEFNGVLREKEGAAKRRKKEQVELLYPAILGNETERVVPLWLIDSILPHFEMPGPDVVQATQIVRPLTTVIATSREMKAVIFDLDGTLVDSLGDIAHASNYALTQLGYQTFTIDEYRLIAGGGNKRLITRALKIRVNGDPDPELVQQAVALKVNYENGPKGHEHTHPFPGTHDMLRTLSKNGIQLAVLSNKSEPNVREIVGDVFADLPWKYVAGARDDTPLKPDPTAALRIVNNYFPGVEPSDCIFVGDTDYDMKTAKSAGMVPVGVSWGNRAPPDLYACGAATVAGKPEDIASFVLNKMDEHAETTGYLKRAVKVM